MENEIHRTNREILENLEKIMRSVVSEITKLRKTIEENSKEN